MKTNVQGPRRMRLWLYIILLLIASGAMIALKTCSHNKNLIQSAPIGDTITVGIQYAPLSFYVYDDTLGGFDYDMMRLIANHNHIVFKFKPITTEQEGLTGLTDGRYDIVAADFPVTAELRADYLFTDPIYLDRQVLIQKNEFTDSVPRITNVLDLRDDTVYVPVGSSMVTRLKHLGEELGDTIHVNQISCTPEQLFIKVAIGEISYAVINEQTAKALLPDYPDMDISTSISFSQLQPWILAKHNRELCDSIDKWIKEIKTTPEYETITNRYLK